MPAPPPTAEVHQASQEAVAALVVPILDRAWALVDLENLDGTLPRFRQMVQAVIDRYGQAAAAIAIQHFKAVRFAADVPGRVNVVPTAATPEGFIDQLVVESVAEAITDEATGRTALDSGAEHLVMEQGRRQMLSAVALDKEARGWARITHPGACSFCLMLAIRAGAGLLYTSKRAANFRAHYKQPDGSGGDCRCTAEPVFGRYEPTAAVRDAMQTWDEATKGRSGHDARVAFRQAVEGREVTGAKDKPGHKTLRKGEGKTPENQRAQQRVLQALPPAKTPEAAKWRADRLAEIRKYLSQQ